MSGHNELDCKKLRRLIDEYVVGDISVENRREVEEHLQLCAECRGYWRAIRNAWQSLGSVDDVPRPSPALIRRTAQAVEQAVNQPAPVFARPVSRFALVAAAMAISFGLGVATSTFMLQQNEEIASAGIEARKPQSARVSPTVLPVVAVRKKVTPVSMDEDIRRRLGPNLRLPYPLENWRRSGSGVETVSYESR